MSYVFWLAKSKPRQVFEMNEEATLFDLHELLHRETKIGLIYYGAPEPGYDGWCHEDPDEHCHGFTIGERFRWGEGKLYASPNALIGADPSDHGYLGVTDETTLRSLDMKVGDRLSYVYDFGSSRYCTLIMRKVPALVEAQP